MGGICPKLSGPSGAEVYIGLHVGLAEEDSMRGGYRCGRGSCRGARVEEKLWRAACCGAGGVLRRRRGGRWPDLRGVLTGTGLGHESGGFAPPARAATGRQDGVRGAGAPRRQGGRRMRPSRGGRESHTGGDFLGCFAMRPAARTQDRLALIFSRMQRYVTGTS